MNARQKKEADSYIAVQFVFDKYKAQMIAATPGIEENIIHYKLLYDGLVDAMADAGYDISGFKTDLKRLKAQCTTGIWNFYLSVHYRHKKLKDDLTIIKIRQTQTTLKIKNPVDLNLYAQTLFDLYVPADYVGLGVTEAEINALKLLFTKYINKADDALNARINKRLSNQKVTSLLKEIPEYLADHVDALARVSLASDDLALNAYNKSRYKGLVSPTRGNPDKKGKLGPGAIVVLDKHEYRTKKIIIVINPGKTPLTAGIGLKATEFTGTPYLIEPGTTRQRISNKLASEGEYILLQNMGDVEGEYKVWMTE